MNTQQQHVQRLVHVALIFGKVQRKCQDKRQLQHFRGLELDKAQIQPRLVIGTGTLVSQRRKGQQREHQCHRSIQEPEPDEFVVIDRREHQQASQTQSAGEQLRPVIAGAHRTDNVILPDRVQQDNAQHGTEQCRQNQRLVQPPPVDHQRAYWFFTFVGFV